MQKPSEKSSKVIIPSITTRNKQNGMLVLPIFCKGIVTVSSCYFPDCRDMSGFLDIFRNGGQLQISNNGFYPTQLGNAVLKGDKITEFYKTLAACAIGAVAVIIGPCAITKP